jgi:hypothetical protein
MPEQGGRVPPVTSNAVAAVITFLRSMRASWHFGGATRSNDPASALPRYRRVLELVSPDRVDVEAPWCRALVPFALAGYCDAAQKLGRSDEATKALARWRPVYRQWLAGPLTEDERTAYTWLEAQS